jgi:peptide/nickel transport system permease protein
MRYYQRVDAGLDSLRSAGGRNFGGQEPGNGELEETGMVKLTDYANISQVANVRILPFRHRQVWPGCVDAAGGCHGVSLLIGFVCRPDCHGHWA